MVKNYGCHAMSSAEWCFSNKECKALRILHVLERIHHYCFVRGICVFTDHEPLVAILNKDVVILSQLLQHIMLQIYPVQGRHHI